MVFKQLPSRDASLSYFFGCAGHGKVVQSGKPSSTIGFEKRTNAALSLARSDFIALLLRDLPPRPPEMDVIAAVNAGLRHAP